MAVTFSTGQFAELTLIINRYLSGPAPENQLHDTEIELLAKLAVEIGFTNPANRPGAGKLATTGDVKQLLRDNPITGLLQLTAFVGHP